MHSAQHMHTHMHNAYGMVDGHMVPVHGDARPPRAALRTPRLASMRSSCELPALARIAPSRGRVGRVIGRGRSQEHAQEAVQAPWRARR